MFWFDGQQATANRHSYHLAADKQENVGAKESNSKTCLSGSQKQEFLLFIIFGGVNSTFNIAFALLSPHSCKHQCRLIFNLWMVLSFPLTSLLKYVSVSSSNKLKLLWMTEGGVFSLDDHLDGHLVPHTAEVVVLKHTSKTTADGQQARMFYTWARRTRITIPATYIHIKLLAGGGNMCPSFNKR